ncbi:MAG: hypothetical protein K0S51_2257, partial [Bacillales bacterium]|nr:hypothetical protein [Bacillales bacterium]
MMVDPDGDVAWLIGAALGGIAQFIADLISGKWSSVGTYASSV